jgi:hypothetical protein
MYVIFRSNFSLLSNFEFSLFYDRVMSLCVLCNVVKSIGPVVAVSGQYAYLLHI